MAKHELHLTISATPEDVLMVRMAVSSLGMLAGLDADLIGDLRTVSNECCDCLLHRSLVPERLEVKGRVEDNRLWLSFAAVGAVPADEAAAELLIDKDLISGVLGTLMPEVELQEDELGIVSIRCSMPAFGDAGHE